MNDEMIDLLSKSSSCIKLWLDSVVSLSYELCDHERFPILFGIFSEQPRTISIIASLSTDVYQIDIGTDYFLIWSDFTSVKPLLEIQYSLEDFGLHINGTKFYKY